MTQRRTASTHRFIESAAVESGGAVEVTGHTVVLISSGTEADREVFTRALALIV